MPPRFFYARVLLYISADARLPFGGDADAPAYHGWRQIGVNLWGFGIYFRYDQKFNQPGSEVQRRLGICCCFSCIFRIHLTIG